jgi:hypothetical protein
MRKKTTPRTRKQDNASSAETSGLIAKGKNRTQSARAKPTLDNRPHRTPWHSPAPREARCQVQCLVMCATRRGHEAKLLRCCQEVLRQRKRHDMIPALERSATASRDDDELLSRSTPGVG